MESKVLHVTFTKSQTASSKGGHLLFNGETELRPDIAAYMVDIMGKNCKITIEPEEGQGTLDLDKNQHGQTQMTYDNEDEEEMKGSLDEGDQGM